MGLRPILLPLLLVALAAPAAGADAAPSVTVTMSQPGYGALDVLAGSPPIARVALLDGAGAPAPGELVVVEFIRTAPGLGFVRSESVQGITGPDGTVAVAAPRMSGLPGDYTVIARGLGALGSARYWVGV